jgi:hypothetical protein
MDEIIKEFLAVEGKKKIEGDILKDVHLVGFKSSNTLKGQKEPYSYTAEALKKAVDAGLYNNRVIGMDHQKDADAINNKASNRIGVTLNSRFVESKGIVGDIRLNTQHPLSNSVIWWADNYPDKMGLSHIAKVRFSEATNSVVEIKEVEIIDFVGNSSTTNGIFAEGVIKDTIDLNTEKNKLYTVIDTAWTLIHRQLYPLEKDLTRKEKAVNIAQVVADLLAELKKIENPSGDSVKESTQNTKENTMEWNDVTLETLKANKPDLVSGIASEAVKAEKLILTQVKESVKGLPEAALTEVFLNLVESQIRAGNKVDDLIADRKSVMTVVESRTSEPPKKTEEKPKVLSDDDILSAIRNRR